MMKKRRRGHTMEVVNGKLTVYGGWGDVSTSIEELNDDGESWSLMDSKLKHGFLGVSVVVPSTKPN